MPTDDLPYEPVARDRAAERTRCEAEIPDYTEARTRAAAQFVSGHWGVDLDTFEADQQREATHDAALGT
jgi:hypothetical protein